MSAMAAPKPELQGSAERSSAPAVGSRSFPRRVPWAVVAVALVAAGLRLPDPICLLLGVTVAASLLVVRWLPLDAAVPMAVLGLVAVATSLGLLAETLRWDLLAHPWLMGAGWTSFALSCLVASLRSRARIARPVHTFPFLVAQLPACVAVVLAVLQQLDLRRVASWAFAGTDFTQHAIILQAVQREGSLHYGPNPYPGGAHTLLALVSVPGLPAPGTAELLSYDLRLLAAGTWLAFALLLWTMAAVVLRAAPLLLLPPAWATATAVALGAFVSYQGAFVSVFFPMAAAPGLLAAVALAIVPLVALSLPVEQRTPAMLLSAAIATAAVAHLWTALILIPAAAFLVALANPSGARAARSWALSLRRKPGVALALLTGTAASACLTAVPVLALLGARGLGTAAIEGGLLSPSWIYLSAGGSAVAVLLFRSPVRVAALGGAAVGCLGTIALLLIGAGEGIALDQYYPRKGIWFLVTILLPASAVLVGCLLRLAWQGWTLLCARLHRAGWVLRVSGVSVASAVFLALVLPVLIHDGSIFAAAARPAFANDQRRLDAATELAGKYSPAVSVPVGLGLGVIPNRHDTYIIAKLMQLKTGQPQTFGLPTAVCQAIEEVAAGGPAVVVTDLPTDLMEELMRRQGCPGSRVVTYPGADPGLQGFLRQQLLRPIPR